MAGRKSLRAQLRNAASGYTSAQDKTKGRQGMSYNTFGRVFRFTTWGESHGPALGVVIDGCVRDTAELATHAVGIRALAPMPLPTEKRKEGQANVAVQIQGVWVHPGDWLYADEDGIVIAAKNLQDDSPDSAQ